MKSTRTSLSNEVRSLRKDPNKWTEATGKLEFKEGRGGFPKDLWATYSAFANTEGGIIVIGVQDDGTVIGLGDAEVYRKKFTNILSGRTKCDQVLCREGDIEVVDLDGKRVLAIRVHEAPVEMKPIYLDGQPTKCYIRQMEGDVQCSAGELQRMLRDKSTVTEQFSADEMLLPGSGLKDLDAETIRQYREALRTTRGGHPWGELSNEELLTKLGAYGMSRQSGERGLTLAGLLMFGRTEAIRELHPIFKLDYFEYDGSEQGYAVRGWIDRVTTDGTWESNLYQFFQDVLPRLTENLKRPFRLLGGIRRDDSPAHDAVREALANAIVHADYREPGGIRIIKRPDGLEFRNAGTLLMDKEDVLAGGKSICRNLRIQNMFMLAGIVEEAGSGVDTLIKGWTEQFLTFPDLEEDKRAPFVTWRLPYLAMVNKHIQAIQRLYLGYKKYDCLPIREKMILLTIPSDRPVSNQELRVFHPAVHSSDMGKALLHLRDEGYIQSEGHSSGTKYCLAESLAKSIENAQHEYSPDPDTDGANSKSHGGQAGTAPIHSPAPEVERELNLPNELRQQLSKYREIPRHSREETDEIVLTLCSGRYVTSVQLSLLLNRDAKALRRDCISALLRHGKLRRREDIQIDRNQSYTTT